MNKINRYNNEDKRLLAVMAGIIAVLIVMIVLVSCFQHKAKKAEEASIAEASAQAESAAEESESAQNAAEFSECDIPEINMLVGDYFKARLGADTSKLLELFGRKDTSADPELESKLKAQADWIQSFNPDKVYVAPGLDDSTRLCLVLYNIDFRRTDTIAPGIMYFYVRRADDGSYTIVDNPVKEEYDYIQNALSGASAKQIIDSCDSELKSALDSDSTLALIYDSFRSGQIYAEHELDVERDQNVEFSAEDSVLVDDSVLANIENEAESAAALESSLAAEDENQ